MQTLMLALGSPTAPGAQNELQSALRACARPLSPGMLADDRPPGAPCYVPSSAASATTTPRASHRAQLAPLSTPSSEPSRRSRSKASGEKERAASKLPYMIKLLPAPTPFNTPQR